MQRFPPDEATRNRLDFVTLRDGGVVLYRSDAILAEDLAWFRAEGYQVREFDGTKWKSKEDLLAQFDDALRFPPYFGFNLDAFNECLSEDSVVPEGGLVIVIRGIDSTVKTLGRTFAQNVLNLLSLASHEQLLYDQRLMFLLQSGNPRLEFETVGARPVCWNHREWTYADRGI
jgi:RNAse (barnase) inhibitor barstar